MPKPTNKCGDCTLCCTIMGIHDLPEPKPRNETCTHCGTGCQIYESRPPSCRTYECLWLQSQGSDMTLLPESMRPDRCHALFNPSENGDMIVCEIDTQYPDAWQSDTLFWFLFNLHANVPVILSIGADKYKFKGDFKPQKLRQVSDDGHISRYILDDA